MPSPLRFNPVYLFTLVTIVSQLIMMHFKMSHNIQHLSHFYFSVLNYLPYISNLLGCSHFLDITESCEQDLFVTVFLVCSISKCVTGILIRVTIRDSIHDSIIIDILPSGLYDLPELSFHDPICVFGVLIFRTILCHNTRRVFFNPNILHIRILFLYHVPQKMVAYIDMFGTH